MSLAPLWQPSHGMIEYSLIRLDGVRLARLIPHRWVMADRPAYVSAIVS